MLEMAARQAGPKIARSMPADILEGSAPPDFLVLAPGLHGPGASCPAPTEDACAARTSASASSITRTLAHTS